MLPENGRVVKKANGMLSFIGCSIESKSQEVKLYFYGTLVIWSTVCICGHHNTEGLERVQKRFTSYAACIIGCSLYGAVQHNWRGFGRLVRIVFFGTLTAKAGWKYIVMTGTDRVDSQNLFFPESKCQKLEGIPRR